MNLPSRSIRHPVGVIYICYQIWFPEYIPPDIWRKWKVYVPQTRDGFCQVMPEISLNPGAVVQPANATVLPQNSKPYKGFNGIQPTAIWSFTSLGPWTWLESNAAPLWNEMNCPLSHELTHQTATLLRMQNTYFSDSDCASDNYAC